MAKNYYFILGVRPDASSRQIRSAYLQRAKSLHPDHFGPDPRPFLDVQEAYSILSDPKQRREYDRRLNEWRVYPAGRAGAPEPLATRKPSVEPLKPKKPPVDLGEASLARSFQTIRPSLDEIFDRLWGNFRNLSRRKGEVMESLTLEIALTPEEAVRGGHVRILVPSHATCPTCGGFGGVDFYECWRCAGEGAISGEFPLLVSFPAGVSGSHLVKIPLDRFGIRNLYLTVKFRVSAGSVPHP